MGKLTAKEKLSNIGFKTKEVYIIYTNTDLTEGRGFNYPSLVCESESTAKRLGLNRGVQGTVVIPSQGLAVFIDNEWYAPVNIKKPSQVDIEQDEKLNKLAQVLEKIKSLNLTDNEMDILLNTTQQNNYA